MKNNFEWKTEDDAFEDVWEPDINEQPQMRRRRWRRWVKWITAVLLLSGLSAAFMYSQLERRAAVVAIDLSQDVIAVHQLVMETAVSRDTDLFQTFLSHPTGKWGSNQTQLVTRDLYLNRAPLGIWIDTNQIVTSTLNQSNVTTRFSPDLQRVEVQVKQSHLIRTADNVIEPVVLVKTAVYQNQNTSWLLTAPDSTFWGEKLQVENSIVTLNYPARDAQIAEKLAVDLNYLLAEACEAELFPCPRNLALDLYLQTDEIRLLTLNREFRLNSRFSTQLGRRYSLSLPTPTLVGLPIDEPGYQALYQGYAAQVLAAMIVNLNVGVPGEFVPDYSLLTEQLALFDLAVPKPVGFHVLDTAVPAPIPLPDEDIILFCPGSRSSLYQYNVGAEQWQTIPMAGQVYGVMHMPNADGMLITKFTGTGSHLSWWRQGEEIFLMDNANDVHIGSVFLLPGETEPPRYAIHVQFRAINEIEWMLLDTAKCMDGVCELTPIDSWSIVSPNGRFQFTYHVEKSMASDITIENDSGQQLALLESAFSPVWLADNRFAFVRMDPFFLPDVPSQSTLVLGNLSGGVVVTREFNPYETAPFLQTGDLLENLLVGGISPASDGQLLLHFYTQEKNRQMILAYLVLFNPETGAASLYDDLRPYEAVVHLGNSPDSRYLVLGILEQETVSMRFYDIETEQSQTYEVLSAWRGYFDWTPDSQWVQMIESDGVQLIAPSYEYERRIVHDFGRCETAVWVNKP